MLNARLTGLAKTWHRHRRCRLADRPEAKSKGCDVDCSRGSVNSINPMVHNKWSKPLSDPTRGPKAELAFWLRERTLLRTLQYKSHGSPVAASANSPKLGCGIQRKSGEGGTAVPCSLMKRQNLGGYIDVRYSPKVGILTEQASGNHPAYSDTRPGSFVLEIGNLLNPSESGRTLTSACHAPLTRDRDHRGCSECVRCVTLLLRYYRNAARWQRQPKRQKQSTDRPADLEEISIKSSIGNIS